MVQYDFAIAYSGCVQNTSFLQIITNKQKIESQVPSVYNDKYILCFGIFVLLCSLPPKEPEGSRRLRFISKKLLYHN